MSVVTDNRRHVVIDTNCVLQILGKHSPYHCIWEEFLKERFIWCISNDILDEYEEIIGAKASPRAADFFIQTILRSPNTVKQDPYYRFNLIETDKDDNKFVDCAIVTNADYIVSEDAHFNSLKSIPFPHVNVIRLHEFLKEFE